MANHRSKSHERKAKVPGAPSAAPQEEQERERTVIEVERSGDWMPVEDLRNAGLKALEAGNDVTFNLDKVEHLDASALQILLALDAEQTKRGKHLELANVSPHMRLWFGYSGIAEHFFPDGEEGQWR